MKKKLKLSFDYWEIMNKLVKQSLEVEVDAKIDKENSEMFKAYCYFRVPLFRHRFLDAISL